MNYEEAAAYIQGRRKAGILPGLSRMKDLCERLGSPEKKLRFIHIAGTNGKGSVAAYISSILGVNGYLTGRFVSPVVFQQEECIQFEDSRGVRNISRELLAACVTEASEAVSRMEKDGRELPSAFEIETAAAFLAFVKEECQVVILEAGLGGREDATNVIDHAELSVLTAISRDHMGMLGDTVAEIAREKAGIIRTDTPVVSTWQLPEAAHVIYGVCGEKNAPVTFLKEEDMRPVHIRVDGCLFDYKGEHYRTRMSGVYQIQNACLAIEACRQFDAALTEEQIMLGIREAYWRGRFDVVSREPLVIVDGAHNEGGARALRETLMTLLPNAKIHGIMGVFRDKEYEKMISILQPVLYDVVTVTPPSPRGLPAEELQAAWQRQSPVAVETAESVNNALGILLERYKAGDAIVVFGSLSLLGELRWRYIYAQKEGLYD